MKPEQLEMLIASEESFFTSDPMERYVHNQARIAAAKEIIRLRAELEDLHDTLEALGENKDLTR